MCVCSGGGLGWDGAWVLPPVWERAKGSALSGRQHAVRSGRPCPQSPWCHGTGSATPPLCSLAAPLGRPAWVPPPFSTSPRLALLAVAVGCCATIPMLRRRCTSWQNSEQGSREPRWKGWQGPEHECICRRQHECMLRAPSLHIITLAPSFPYFRYLERAASTWTRSGKGSQPSSFSTTTGSAQNGGGGAGAPPGVPPLPAALQLGQVHRSMTLPTMGRRTTRHRSLQAIRVDMAALQAGSSSQQPEAHAGEQLTPHIE